MKVTIITPTRGQRWRELKRLAVWTADNMLSGDQHIIVWDGIDTDVTWNLPSLPRVVHLFKRSRESIFGNIQRDYAAMYATGDCLVYCDDDDMLTKEALDILHEEAAVKDTCHAFQMKDGAEIYTKLMGGPQLVLPNQDDIPKWSVSNKYESDKVVINQAKEKYAIIHHPVVICDVRPRGA
jgi:hypothetical protein